jgi:CheY-like chemotaxis protein
MDTPRTIRILLIEDDAAVRRLLERALSLAGYEVDFPDQQQNRADGRRFDLIVTNTRVPYLSGKSWWRKSTATGREFPFSTWTTSRVRCRRAAVGCAEPHETVQHRQPGPGGAAAASNWRRADSRPGWMMPAVLAFPAKSLQYHWQVEIQRVRLQAWATRELASGAGGDRSAAGRVSPGAAQQPAAACLDHSDDSRA